MATPAQTTLAQPPDLRRPVPMPMTGEEKKVIFASSLGTVFEWYDFYLYGSLTTFIAKHFFSGLDAGAAFIFALLAFAAGFIVRPFGALVFGRLRDMIGRKYTFLMTILIMGLSTFGVGVLPDFKAIGWAAPVILISLRLLQGLALGGEYGGAATYVAEHSPAGRRGAYTSWIQTTATGGLILSLLVILATRTLMGEPAFAEWGWRIPFLVSIVLLGVSVWVRLSMAESPAFKKMKAEGKTSKAPLSESFGRWSNLKIVIVALLGLTAGQGVVFYTSQFYVLFFLTQALKVDAVTANILIAIGLIIGTPLFVLFGSLSDRIGRKPVILTGCLLAAVGYLPLFHALSAAANPALSRALQDVPVTLRVDQAQCSFQGSPVSRDVDFKTPCDIAQRTLAQAAVNYTIEPATSAGTAAVQLGTTQIAAPTGTLTPDGNSFDAPSKAAIAKFKADVSAATKAAGYPAKADPATINKPMVVLIVVALVALVALVYGPIAAALVEMFPTRIRYTSMSLPYHIGNGWFGGLLPTTAFAIVAQTGNIYNGLWYPIVVAAATFVIGVFFVKETKNVDIYARD